MAPGQPRDRRGFSFSPAALLLSPSSEAAVHINEDPYPSTYVRYPGAPTVIRHATVFDGEGGRIDNGTVVIADGMIKNVGGADVPVACRSDRDRRGPASL